eukprot:TRINITY_DN1648_c0_g1_i3.p2 TRINITY_DN1648_c0_g1~~TRINITY_DN1648_c0_g1_i3.p2  ORF type:complete len:336 (-),score=121.92 TRINITY_DN1648_c0_g1_i3:33-1040(-)
MGSLAEKHQAFVKAFNDGVLDTPAGMLAPDVTLKNADGGDYRGKEQVFALFAQNAPKVKGIISKIEPTKVLGPTCTRVVYTIKKMMVTMVAEETIVWNADGLIASIVRVKDPPAGGSPVPDLAKPAAAAPAAAAPAPAAASGSGSAEDVLAPPYLVARPDTFAAPSVHIEVLSAANLDNGAYIRPLNAYCTVALGKHAFKSKVIKANKNPVWTGPEAAAATFSLAKEELGETVTVVLWDWNVLRDSMLGVVSIPLAQLALGETVRKTAPIHAGISPTGDVTLALRLENPELVWLRQEIAARQKAKMEVAAAAVAQAQDPVPELESDGSAQACVVS